MDVLLKELRDPSNSGAACKVLVLKAAVEIDALLAERDALQGKLRVAVKALRYCKKAAHQELHSIYEASSSALESIGELQTEGQS